MGHIHQTPHLAHVVLLSVISSSHSLVRFHCIDNLSIYPVFRFSMLYIGHRIQSSQHSASISCSDYITALLFCLVVYALLILHAQYLSSTDAYVHYTF